ncbi:hypothetical protein PHLCEN_2v10203 [Hermanssonia centrifuga]|uniref:Flavin reductase like domain-containing protein n=1 Tax=Hermanssonia centrifuga TaxID=98765 RepID=A0A2R6NPJ2_9APHY|nr:hypothetical protein PHLCEN_2v10203 [Hermanssonia centrifuga]
MSSAALPPFDFSPAKAAYTEKPHPGWVLGQRTESTPDGKEWVEGEKEGWKVIDTSKEDPMKLYALMISGIIPRPIAFVSSVSEAGVENLAPFSWFNMVTHYPPVLSISIAHVAGKLKDTPTNIKATKNFVVNIISEPFVEQANITSIDCPPEINEWDLSGLTKVPSDIVKAPRVKESAFSMECELFQSIDIVHPDTGAATTTLILGLVKCIHVRNDVLNERGVVDVAKFKAVGRLGDISYSTTGTPFRVAREQWKIDGEKISEFLKGLQNSGLGTESSPKERL